MGTHGIGVYGINSKFASGNLVFYEKAVGQTTTGDVFTIAGGDSGYVRVGNTTQDIDFQWYGTGSKSFVLNLSAATAVSSGLAWTITGTLAVTGNITLTGDVSLEGDLTLTTEDVSVIQGRYVYLAGQNGGEYLVSDTTNYAMLNGTTGVNIAVGGTDEVSISATAVTLGSNDLTLTAGDISVVQGSYIYLDGQGGGEYLLSDGAAEATLNAATTLNLAIGGTDEFSITATTITSGATTLTLTGGNLALTADDFISGAPIKQLRTPKSGAATLTTAEAGIIPVSVDDVYIYLPTYIGNAGLCYTIKATAAHSAGIHVIGTNAQLIDGNSIQTSAARYNFITVAAGTQGWDVISQFGTWVGTV